MYRTFKFNFELSLINKLRNVIISNNEFITKVEKEISNNNKNKIKIYIWDVICSSMDRIQDTLLHLNTLEIGHCKNRTAFDFIEFINCMSVVIDCIKKIDCFFNNNTRTTADLINSKNVFEQSKGDDIRYFEYIRSICSVHPANTNRHNLFQNGDIYQTSPYIRWTNGITPYLYDETYDLKITVYSSKLNFSSNCINLKVDDFVKYLSNWIEYINNIINNVLEFKNSRILELKKETIKDINDFNSITHYLDYLKVKFCERFGPFNNYLFDKYKRVFSMSLSNKVNENKFTLYKNAIIYSLSFVRNSIINVSLSGYENSGIIGEDNYFTGSLFVALSYCEYYTNEFNDYEYHLEKLRCLQEDSIYDELSKEHARFLIFNMKPLINKYVYFNNDESDLETLLLIDLTLYFSALNENSIIAMSIPNTRDFKML